MSIADKLETVAENQEKVFEAGKTKEWSDFWDVLQNYDGATEYRYAFAYSKWTDDNYNPKHPILINGTNMCQYAFGYSNITETKVAIIFEPDSDNNSDSNNMFYRAENMVKINGITFNEHTTFSNTFYRCNKLEELYVYGMIGQNGLVLQWSTKLTHDSLMSIINALVDKSGDTSETWKITLGTENYARLTADEISIAEQKGWNIE